MHLCLLPSSMRRFAALLTAAAVAFHTTSAFAADNAWVSAADGNWYDAHNWSAGVPVFGQHVEALQAGYSIYLDDTGTYSIESLKAKQYLYVSNGSQLSIVGDLILEGTSGGPYASVYAQDTGTIVSVGSGSSTITNYQGSVAALNGGWLYTSAADVDNRDGGWLYASGQGSYLGMSGGAGSLSLTNQSGGLIYAADAGVVGVDAASILNKSGGAIQAFGTGTFLESQVHIGVWDGSLNNSGVIAAQDGGYIGISSGGVSGSTLNNLSGGLIESSAGSAITLFNSTLSLNVVNHAGGTLRALGEGARLEILDNFYRGGSLENRGVIEASAFDPSTELSGGLVNVDLASVVNNGGLITAYDLGVIRINNVPGTTGIVSNLANKTAVSRILSDPGGDILIRAATFTNNLGTPAPNVPINAAELVASGGSLVVQADEFINKSLVWKDDPISPGLARGQVYAENGGYLKIGPQPGAAGKSAIVNTGDIWAQNGGAVLLQGDEIRQDLVWTSTTGYGGTIMAFGTGAVLVNAYDKFDNAGGQVQAIGGSVLLASYNGTVQNSGLLVANSGGQLTVNAAQFIQDGTLYVYHGSTATATGGTITTGGGSLTEVAHTGSQLNLGSAAGDRVTNNGEIRIRENGRLEVTASDAKNLGLLNVMTTGTAYFANGLLQKGSSAVTRVNGTLTVDGPGLTLGNPGDPAGSGGLLAGYGTVVGTVTNNSGIINPGGSPGKLTIDGDLHNKSAGELLFEIAGTAQGVSYDWLNVLGDAYIDGTLNFLFDSNVAFGDGSVFNLLTARNLHLGNWRWISNRNDINIEQFGDNGGFGLRIVLRRDPGTGGGGGAVPEPGTWALLFGAGVGFAVLRRRRTAQLR
jgi:fibronectin-binding autotransporter adhesin